MERNVIQAEGMDSPSVAPPPGEPLLPTWEEEQEQEEEAHGAR